jgi:hypothetical protein
LDLCLLLLYIVLTTQKNSLTAKTFERLSLFGLVPSFSEKKKKIFLKNIFFLIPSPNN